MLVPIYSNIKAFDVVKDFGSMTFCVDIGPSQKSGHILSLKYAFTLGNENEHKLTVPKKRRNALITPLLILKSERPSWLLTLGSATQHYRVG